MKLLALFVILVSFTATALAGKPNRNPAVCPCENVIIDLVAQTECTTFVNSFKVGKGKRNTIKRTLWADSHPELETDPETDTDTDSCYLVDVNTPEARVDAYSGFPNGGSTCFYATNVPGRPDPPRCTISGLSSAELKACFADLEAARQEVSALPDCPEGAIP